jgi:hypothetical protein
MTITITCTKSKFRENLRNRYVTGVVIDRAQADELDEVIDGLVRQADEHRGTFTGHSAYLDLDFTVTPDSAAPDCPVCATEGNAGEHHNIPAVTDAQRTEARDAAHKTIDSVRSALAANDGPFDRINADRLEDLGAMLYAAAGHLRIANS